MKKELQEYSKSKATYVKEHYTEFWKYGIEYNTLEEFFDYYAKDCTPEESGYDTVDTIHFGESVSTLNDFIKLYKDYIDYEYNNPNPCWAVYLLY